MKPSPESLYFSQVLTNLSVAYRLRQDRYVSTLWAPVVPTARQADRYTIFSKADFTRDEAVVRPDGKETAGIGFGLSRDSYLAELYGVHFDITPRMRVNAGPDVDLEQTGMRLVTDKLLLRQERAWVDRCFKAGVWTGMPDQTGVASAAPGANQFTHFSDYANSKPKKVIKDACTAIEAATGYRPNTLVLGRKVFDALQDHPDFADRLKYTSAESITAEILARMLELDNVRVAGGVVNTAAEGQPANLQFIHGKHMLLGYVNPEPQKEMPSAAYTFGWTDMVPGAEAAGVAIAVLPRDPKTKVDRVEGESGWDIKVVGADLAVFFADAVP